MNTSTRCSSFIGRQFVYRGWVRAALYLRVSTEEQNPESQAAEVRQLAEARGFDPVEYREVKSAAKARPVFDRGRQERQVA